MTVWRHSPDEIAGTYAVALSTETPSGFEYEVRPPPGFPGCLNMYVISVPDSGLTCSSADKVSFSRGGTRYVFMKSYGYAMVQVVGPDTRRHDTAYLAGFFRKNFPLAGFYMEHAVPDTDFGTDEREKLRASIELQLAALGL